MARLYVDENSGSLVPPLRAAGHDVMFAGESGTGRSDAWHFRQAITDRRTIITLDSDFYDLHGLWTVLMILQVADLGHSGILTAIQDRQFTHDGWSTAIVAKLADEEELHGRILTWHARENVWKAEVRPPWGRLI